MKVHDASDFSMCHSWGTSFSTKCSTVYFPVQLCMHSTYSKCFVMDITVCVMFPQCSVWRCTSGRICSQLHIDWCFLSFFVVRFFNLSIDSAFLIESDSLVSDKLVCLLCWQNSLKIRFRWHWYCLSATVRNITDRCCDSILKETVNKSIS